MMEGLCGLKEDNLPGQRGRFHDGWDVSKSGGLDLGVGIHHAHL